MSLKDEHITTAHNTIVARHGTKVLLDQVMNTLIDLGWSPPRGSLSVPVTEQSPVLVTCDVCGALVDPTLAALLCRLPPDECLFRAPKK